MLDSTISNPTSRDLYQVQPHRQNPCDYKTSLPRKDDCRENGAFQFPFTEAYTTHIAHALGFNLTFCLTISKSPKKRSFLQ